MIEQKVLQNKLLYPFLVLEDALHIQQLQTRIQLNNRSLSNLTDAVQHLLQGSNLVFFLNSTTCLSVDVKNTSMRSIMGPTTEKIIRSAHDGFIENVHININIIHIESLILI